jgi:hypothetical protein
MKSCICQAEDLMQNGREDCPRHGPTKRAGRKAMQHPNSLEEVRRRQAGEWIGACLACKAPLREGAQDKRNYAKFCDGYCREYYHAHKPETIKRKQKTSDKRFHRSIEQTLLAIQVFVLRTKGQSFKQIAEHLNVKASRLPGLLHRYLGFDPHNPPKVNVDDWKWYIVEARIAKQENLNVGANFERPLLT